MRKCTCSHVIGKHGSDRACFFCSCTRFVDVVVRYGHCKKCGCTDDMACEGGCGWSDSTHTLCTACEAAA